MLREHTSVFQQFSAVSYPNMYFTIDRKVSRFIKTTLKIYEVPKAKIEEIIKIIEQFKMQDYAKEVISTLYEYISIRT